MEWLSQPVPWLFVIVVTVWVGWSVLRAIDRLRDEVRRLRERDLFPADRDE